MPGSRKENIVKKSISRTYTLLFFFQIQKKGAVLPQLIPYLMSRKVERLKKKYFDGKDRRNVKRVHIFFIAVPDFCLKRMFMYARVFFLPELANSNVFHRTKIISHIEKWSSVSFIIVCIQVKKQSV